MRRVSDKLNILHYTINIRQTEHSGERKEDHPWFPYKIYIHKKESVAEQVFL
jgi:hypothetical protein